jgi:hypothetical protein
MSETSFDNGFRHTFCCDTNSVMRLPAGTKGGRFSPLSLFTSQQTSDMTTYNILPENLYNWVINLKTDTSMGVDPFDLINDTDQDLVLFFLCSFLILIVARTDVRYAASFRH